ncbi:MAG: TMEM165/GDT1 family protein [Pseudomonadota bacterium]|nr:TMEM165/GDT1 family protein [Pseudomonadota bacterium]
MNAFLVSAGIVAIGEIGDKTQLLALLLAARFKRPRPIIAGIVFATLLNHAAAGFLGSWLHRWLDPVTLKWLVGVSFILIAGWALVPDKLAERDRTAASTATVFATTAFAFFLAEIGDKTQIATVMLAARFDNLFAVISGTTIGMLLADVPAVLLADRLGSRLPVRAIRRVAAALFLVLGVWTLLGSAAS